jgi:hypothetical protein
VITTFLKLALILSRTGSLKWEYKGSGITVEKKEKRIFLNEKGVKTMVKGDIFKKLICLSLLLLLICGLIVSNILTVNGSYKVREVKVQYDGYTLEGSLFIPKAVLEMTGEYTAAQPGEFVRQSPAVVMQGGGSANRYIMYPHMIEFIKRGFVVFAIDAYTHGASENYNAGWGVYSQVHDALKYLHSLNFVDDAHVGYMGHSQGGSAAMMALKNYAGYYTLPDKLFNMLHDELGVEITPEQVDAQDADAVAAILPDYEQGYYESRKTEIVEEFNDSRVSFGIILGMATGAAPPLRSKEFPNVDPACVEVGGVPVTRNIYANIGNIVTLSDESIGMNALKPMQISSTKELAQSPYLRAFFGTGDKPVQLDTIYEVHNTKDENFALSTSLGVINENSYNNAAVINAGDSYSLRMLTMYPGWHNTNHFSQKDISTAANFAVLATGYNNGYLKETGGTGAVGYNDTHTWKTAFAFTYIGFFALILLTMSVAAVIFKTGSFSAAVCEPIEAQASKKDKKVWLFTLLVVILPVVLITPLMNNSIFKASWFAKFDRICPIAFWSICCALILLILMIIKWKKYDSKNTDLTFREFYGITGSVKTIALTLFAAFLTWTVFMIVINVYYRVFNSANFTIALPFLHMTFQLTPISTERFIDYFFYFLYFLPYWIIGGMLVNSARMRDMSETKNTLIITLLNLIPIALFVYISYAGNIITGGTKAVLGLNWATLIQMQGLTLAIPVAVVISRVLYKRTGSVLPGALINSMIFTLPFMCTVVSYTVSSMPIR